MIQLSLLFIFNRKWWEHIMLSADSFSFFFSLLIIWEQRRRRQSYDWALRPSAPSLLPYNEEKLKRNEKNLKADSV